MKFICCECSQIFSTMGAVHWHLRIEHDYSKDEAFEFAGQSAYEGEAPSTDDSVLRAGSKDRGYH